MRLIASAGIVKGYVNGKKMASRTFVVNLQNLSSGEYGFLPPGAFVSASSPSSLGTMYTFSALE